ncbi:MAG: DUF5666 domain-containing protein [Shewanella sp.]
MEGQPNGVLFLASEVDVEDAQDNSAFDEMELEGTISWVNQDKSLFELNGRTRLFVDDKTQFEDGVRSKLAEGQRVEVEIKALTQGLWAKEIDFESETDGQIPPTSARKFALEGRATLVNNNQLTINGFTFVIDAQTQLDDGLTLNTLDQQWLEIEGVELASGEWLVKEIDRETQGLQLDLAGEVIQNSLWGYSARDASLAPFAGKWVDVECQFDGSQIYNCRRDD